MQKQPIRTIYIKNMLLFLFFGILVSAVTTYINYSMQFEEIDQKIENDSIFTSDKIKSNIKSYIDKIDDSIEAVSTNRLFINYLQDPTSLAQSNVIELFLNTMKNNKNVFQLRYIDASGIEKLRLDRETATGEVRILQEEFLQDKSKRYYFKETMSNTIGNYWYSHLDLNIERGVIEKPIKPTLRVSSKMYHNKKLYGIVIVNIAMESLLEYISYNNQFDVYIVDSDGYFILHPEKEKNWSRYLQTKHTLYTEFPHQDQETFALHRFGTYGKLFSLEEYFKNNEGLRLGLNIKEEFISDIQERNLEFAYTLGLIILLISIPIGFLISIPTSKLYIDFNRLYKDNVRYMHTIDKYVLTMNIGLDKKITEVSSALCQSSGYSKEEILGKKPSLFKSGKMQDALYEDLWSKVTNGLVWNGELQNKKKNGEDYWIDAVILPNYNEHNEIVNYTSISKDITDKKIIEKISETDKLTQIYNRIKLDDTLEKEFQRFLRHKHIFSLIIMDIDHFKSVNDTYGHQVGDSVLKEFVKVIKQHSRKTDIVGRWGGEEFMIICVDTDIEGASKLAENLRASVETFAFNIVKHKTVSIGVSQIQDTDNIETLIKRVDDYLYEAKENGRNRVISDTKRV